MCRRISISFRLTGRQPRRIAAHSTTGRRTAVSSGRTRTWGEVRRHEAILARDRRPELAPRPRAGKVAAGRNFLRCHLARRLNPRGMDRRPELRTELREAQSRTGLKRKPADRVNRWAVVKSEVLTDRLAAWVRQVAATDRAATAGRLVLHLI